MLRCRLFFKKTHSFIYSSDIVLIIFSFPPFLFANSRRFSDFLGLHGKLTEKYVPSGRLLPPVPEKDVYNLAMLKIGGGGGGGSQDHGEAGAYGPWMLSTWKRIRCSSFYGSRILSDSLTLHLP